MPSRTRTILLQLIPAIVMLSVWEYSVRDSPRLCFLFSSPTSILGTAIKEYPDSRIWVDIATTTFETLVGLALGSILGAVAGVLLWSNNYLEQMTRPYIVFIGSIPIFALAPMLIIWFGIGIVPKIVMAAFGVFVVALVHTHQGFKATSQQHLHYAKLLNARRIDVVYKILLPGAMHWIIAATQLNVGVAILGAFIGEFVSSNVGLGHYIIEAGQLYDMSAVLFGIANLSLVAVVLSKLVGLLHKE